MKMPLLRQLSTLTVLSGPLVPAGHAVVIAQYDMETLSINGVTSTSADVAGNTDVSAGDFTESLTGGTAQSEFGIQNVSLVPEGVNGVSARSMNADPSNPWWEFTITPSASNTLDLTTMTLDAGIGLTLSNSNWDYNLSWSVDGYASVLGVFDGPTGTNTTITTTGLSVDLSALPEQSSAFTLRLTPDRVSGTNGAASQRAGWVDNVTLNADVSVVPEPSALLLLGVSIVGCLRRRR